MRFPSDTFLTPRLGPSHSVFAAALLTACSILAATAAQQPAATQSNATIEGAIIEGTVTYQSDPARPWRYARYYVKQPKSGELAEAVVAIRVAVGRAANHGDTARQPQTVVIDQENFQFTPETVVIRKGDSVKFTNADTATHNVQSNTDIATFNVNMPAGGDHTVRFDKAGGVRQPATLGCVFHSAMRAWIFVFDHPWYQLTSANGKFRLTEVPPGDYDLEMFHPSGELRSRKRITAKAGETLRIDIRVSPDDKR